MNLRTEEKYIQVGNIQKKVIYKVLEDLPSNKRYYSDIGKVYVRGFFYGEVIEASKIDDNIDDIINIYSDAIKFENEKYSLYDLEPIDFVLLTSIVNILTMPDFSWKPDFECTNIIPNPLIKKLKREIELLEIERNAVLEKLSQAEKLNPDDYKEEVWRDIQNSKARLEKELEEYNKQINEKQAELKKLEETEPEVVCGSKVMTEITLDDFEFEYADPELRFPHYFDIGEAQIELKPLLVKDIIDLENKEDVNELYLLSKYIKDEGGYELLKVSMPWEVEELKEEVERFNITLNPLKTKCKKCGKEYELIIDLKDIKVLP